MRHYRSNGRHSTIGRQREARLRGLMRPVVFVAGARPNFMKIAPILRELARRERWTSEVLIHTGQHYDHQMSGVFFAQLQIREPDVYLQVGSASHGVQTGRIMASFEEYLAGCAERPRGIVVVGDVNSTMACALVAAKLGIPVAHVEAGLRSFDRTMPEEINRVVTDAVADLLLVSEPAGLDNLAREGIPAERVRYVGNVMIDTLVSQLEAARAKGVPERIGLVRGGYALVTLHRPSNVDDPDRLGTLVGFLRRLASALPTIFTVHPRTERRLAELGLRGELETAAGLTLSPPLGYREFLALMDGARVVVSDSGGVQEETTYLGVPCITLRANTERPITITGGTNTLVGDDLGAAWRVVEEVLAGRAPPAAAIEGWDGHAAARVVDALVEAWGPERRRA
jgi:UDP-N-acetylglucosamine 2-epimerase (non-hydrolysing)